MGPSGGPPHRAVSALSSSVPQAGHRGRPLGSASPAPAKDGTSGSRFAPRSAVTSCPQLSHHGTTAAPTRPGPGRRPAPCPREPTSRASQKTAGSSSLLADANAKLDRRRAELEPLPQGALQVAQVRGRKTPGGEKSDRRRVDGSLHAVEDPRPAGSRVGRLRAAQPVIQPTGGDPAVVGVHGVIDRGQQPLHAEPRLRRDPKYRGVAQERQPVGHRRR